MLKRCTTSAGIFSQNGTMKTAGKAPEQYPECNEENSIDGGTTRPHASELTFGYSKHLEA